MSDTPNPQPTALAPVERRQLDASKISSSGPRGGVTFLPQTMEDCVTFAQLMAKSDFAVPPKFRGNPGACLAVVIQSARWGADPFGVIQKAYVTKSKDGSERLAYEAQLVAAIVNTQAPIIGRLALTYSGEGHTRKVKCVGIFSDTGEPREVDTPPVGKITVKNSPLWVSDTDQQLAYYAMRAWGRRWVPEVLLGIYTPEELQVVDEENARNAPRPVRTDHVIENQPANASAEETGIVHVEEPEPAIEAEEVIESSPAEVFSEKEIETADRVAHREEEEPPVEDGTYNEALAGWQAYLQRAKDGLFGPELKNEADMDQYGNLTKATLAAADGITEDDRDELRAQFVSAFLNRKRDLFGKRGR